ncbi:hypothetical protein CVT26_015601 [Gymnopilus dilepis]|uniref:Extracellular membrane protein CFEM domain-containing protein n=1 Tax=Gymnopilus dilepis TaxID=231916 RepID=A0A409XYL4_9AGAR|nr:hypothetical protein CVT26_015601 [Gymnopilus dilepis]
MLKTISTSFFVVSLCLLTFGQTLPTCSVGCFQGTPQNATTPGDAALCPLVPGVAVPFLTSSCLCFTPETFTGPEPFTYCFTCGQTQSGDFSTVCGGSQVTQTCSNQDDVITKACNANNDVNEVLGALCEDGKPTSTVTDISTVVEFAVPELAAGAISLITLGCVEIAGAQAVSDVVSDVCQVWNIAGCGTVKTASETGSNPASTSGSQKSSSTTPAITGGAAGSGSAVVTTTGPASTGSINIASTTTTQAASSSTAPAGSSTGSASILSSGLVDVAFAGLLSTVASLWLLLFC